MVQNSYENALLGELVTDDFRVAEVFKHAGIDFCCGGKKDTGTGMQGKEH